MHSWKSSHRVTIQFEISIGKIGGIRVFKNCLTVRVAKLREQCLKEGELHSKKLKIAKQSYLQFLFKFAATK